MEAKEAAFEVLQEAVQRATEQRDGAEASLIRQEARAREEGLTWNRDEAGHSRGQGEVENKEVEWQGGPVILGGWMQGAAVGWWMGW